MNQRRVRFRPAARVLLTLLAAAVLLAGCGARTSVRAEVLTQIGQMRTAIDAGQWQEAQRQWDAMHTTVDQLFTRLPADQSVPAEASGHRLGHSLQQQDRDGAARWLRELEGWVQKVKE